MSINRTYKYGCSISCGIFSAGHTKLYKSPRFITVPDIFPVEKNSLYGSKNLYLSIKGLPVGITATVKIHETAVNDIANEYFTTSYNDSIAITASNRFISKSYSVNSECFYIELNFGTWNTSFSFELTVRFE
ncbi:MAG TPA: hypothetical protein PKY81_15020 [bacterium]|nr:hypothetical protein [bacterium]